MKICVYAISKNEEQFVDRFMDSIKEADGVFVLDTGSTDKTVKKLKKRGATVKVEKIKPWRFDIARNKSLEMVPNDYDICICLDLDEIIKPGFKQKIIEAWDNNTTRLRYDYIWKFDEFGNPVVNFYSEKIHSRDNYKWTHPVHEILTRLDNREIIKTTDEIRIEHYPDDEKSRGNYLPLLELSVKEDPLDDRNMHYLGREYMFYNMNNECIDTLIKHLNLPKSTWKPERCASMRYISRSYQKLKRFDEAKMWLEKAIIECDYMREPYVEMALLNYNLNEWYDVVYNCNKALEITKNEKNYINEPFCYNETIYDLLSIAYYNMGDIDNSLKNIEIATNINPNDERLINNHELIRNSSFDFVTKSII